MRYKLLYEMIMFFLKLSATGKSLMVISLLHKMQAPNNYFTLLLCDINSCKRNSWRDDNDATMEIKLSPGDDGDHDGASEMEITSTRR